MGAFMHVSFLYFKAVVVVAEASRGGLGFRV